MFCLYKSLYFYFNNKFLFQNYYFMRVNFFKKQKPIFNTFLKTVFINKFSYSSHIINKNDFLFLFKYNNKYFYNFNKNNTFLFKKLFNILSFLFYNNFNALILDSNYKSILPVYNYIFGFKNLYNNKSFFFLEKKNLTRNNWIYLYLINIKKFNINLLIIFDYFFFNKFLPILKKFNLPLLSLIPFNINNVYIDYFVFINYCNLTLSKFFLLNFYSNLFFKFKTFQLFLKKYEYLNKTINLLKHIK